MPSTQRRSAKNEQGRRFGRFLRSTRVPAIWHHRPHNSNIISTTAATRSNRHHHNNNTSTMSSSATTATACTIVMLLGTAAAQPAGVVVPAGCISWNDGCNTCMVHDGVVGGCTRMMCMQRAAPFCVAFDPALAPTAAPTIPAGCISWNDGCNTCMVDNGIIGGCTEMLCAPEAQSAPFCVAFTNAAHQAATPSWRDAADATVAVKPGLLGATVDSGFTAGAGQGARCASGFCENPADCPQCATGLTCIVQPNMMCAGTCYGTCSAATTSNNGDWHIAADATVATGRNGLLGATRSPVTAPAMPLAPTIPASCTSWHDGCNTCMVNNGVIGGCTMMMCFTQSTPHCLAFSEPQPVLDPSFGVDPTWAACDVDRIAADCNDSTDQANFCSSVCYSTSATMEPACTAEGAAFALGLRQMVASCGSKH